MAKQRYKNEFRNTFRLLSRQSSGRRPMLNHKGMADVMLYAAATLILFQYVGQVIADAVAPPVPGAVIALLLLSALWR
jgi:hypothetical protein